MQAQATATAVNTQLMTRTQSLAAVQTLLRAGLSCITFLRNLLPEDNFTETHLTTSDESFPASISESKGGTPQGPGKRSRVNGFRIKTLTRGYTDEADRLLNYLETGIFDALQKQYLRSFIFAVYLDSKDPTNIVEAYTFNFKYHTIPGSDAAVPVMSLGEDLQNMSLDGGRNAVDPVEEAIRKGKAPTVGDVKKSLRTMMKTLIQAITHMDELPRRRFATFKLFYTDNTPEDYEPPLFQTGDEQKDKWYFMTHNLDEVPDRFSVGKLNCGYHTVNLKVTSIATYLPTPLKDDTSLFTGTVSGTAAKGMARSRASATDEALSTALQIQQQQDDAKARNLLWSTEEDVEVTDADAECEDDPDYVRREDGTLEYRPVGVRNEEGEIEEVEQGRGKEEVFVGVAEETQEEVYAGMSERVPTKLKEINSEDAAWNAHGLQATQALVETQPLTIDPDTHGSFTFNVVGHAYTQTQTPPKTRSSLNSAKDNGNGSLPPSNLAMELDSPMSSVPESPIAEFDSGRARASGRGLATIQEDAEMLDLETQPLDIDSQIEESIQSFSLDATKEPAAEAESIEQASPARTPAPAGPPVKDVGLQCDCNITYEDEVCFCEGGCGKWYHVWCMGFHSTDDTRLPDKFICFDCRLKADAAWLMIMGSVYPQIMAKWKDFVTFRRAIKVAETSAMITPALFAKFFDDDTHLTRHLMKRLEEEEYIHTVTTTLNEFGVANETRSKSHKAKDKKTRSRKTVQKSRFAFNKHVKNQQKYKDHFTPEPEVESKMIGLNDYRKFRDDNEMGIARKRASSAALVQPPPAMNLNLETQTQEDSQILPPNEESYRHVVCERELERPSKKQKISLALGIDLAE